MPLSEKSQENDPSFSSAPLGMKGLSVNPSSELRRLDRLYVGCSLICQSKGHMITCRQKKPTPHMAVSTNHLLWIIKDDASQ